MVDQTEKNLESKGYIPKMKFWSKFIKIQIGKTNRQNYKKNSNIQKQHSKYKQTELMGKKYCNA